MVLFNPLLKTGNDIMTNNFQMIFGVMANSVHSTYPKHYVLANVQRVGGSIRPMYHDETFTNKNFISYSFNNPNPMHAHTSIKSYNGLYMCVKDNLHILLVHQAYIQSFQPM